MSTRYALLLDVDGPIASPESRRVRPEITDALTRLSQAGTPLVFNTGRSDAFISQTVLPGLTVGSEGAPIHAICEKGASWFTLTSSRESELHVDESLVLPEALRSEIRDLTGEFADFMFFDETKRAMISVEQNTDVRNELYQRVQAGFDQKAAEAVERHGLSDRVRLDPTIISTDIEDSRVGKDLGADRALELLRADGLDPADYVWRTVGDSRTDYAMADRLHELGLTVAHVDVRPSDGIPEGRPYEVLTYEGLLHDDAGLAFLEELLASLGQPGQ
ncbi:HAD hydrolase family protein [Falsarthrobacter nasiphocae]|uniref:HAD superfamily hydrolase (TIGR01484 family) n=1 Tax=Falsarthrobacter nasiphocae TaxID=189863 RepID=A0AAE4C4Z6_9MICC|nr:HAD hydrolase family protein [Falsarthrobacter nasiphocae]MDR6891831.1 HAD superfamily hydrolase (TIGR01484 family) [Falsarthrobacter nasiphocae]